MTDFLHPQEIAPSAETKDVLEIASTDGGQVDQTPVIESPQPDRQDIDHEASSLPPADNQVNPDREYYAVPANTATNQDTRSNNGPIKRDFAKLNYKSPSERQDEQEQEVKRIVRKESPLFINYYQSVFLLLITLFFVAGYFLLNPLITTFKETNRAIEAALQEKDDANAFLQSIERSIQAAQTIAPDALDRINESLPKEPQVPILLKTFAQIADQDKVEMTGVQFSPKTAGDKDPVYGGYALAPIQVAVGISAPSYAVMRRYLEDLQTNIRLIDVNSITVSGDENGKFTYALDMTMHYLQKVSKSGSSSGSSGIGGGSITPPSAPKSEP